MGIAVNAVIARWVGSNAAAFPRYRDIARLAGVDLQYRSAGNEAVGAVWTGHGEPSQGRGRTTHDHSPQEMRSPVDTQVLDAVWLWYPKKQQQARACAAWQQLAVEDNRELLQEDFVATSCHREQEQWNEERDVPNLAAWLRDQRWEDEVNLWNLEAVRAEALSHLP